MKEIYSVYGYYEGAWRRAEIEKSGVIKYQNDTSFTRTGSGTLTADLVDQSLELVIASYGGVITVYEYKEVSDTFHIHLKYSRNS